MDLERMRKLAGLDTDSVKAPSQLREKVKTPEAEPVLSEKVDFTRQENSTLNALEEAIENNAGRLFALSENKEEMQKDLSVMGLTKVANVTDLGKTVYHVYETANSELWFYTPDDAGSIKETSLTLEDLKSFHNSDEEVDMYEACDFEDTIKKLETKLKKAKADGDDKKVIYGLETQIEAAKNQRTKKVDEAKKEEDEDSKEDEDDADTKEKSKKEDDTCGCDDEKDDKKKDKKDKED